MPCPKCALEPPDGAVECPRCGIVFARYLELQAADGWVYRPAPAPREPGMDWRELLLEEAREPDPLRFWGRAALYACLFIWGWRTASCAGRGRREVLKAATSEIHVAPVRNLQQPGRTPGLPSTSDFTLLNTLFNLASGSATIRARCIPASLTTLDEVRANE